jgi:hypothetical protein
MKHEHQPHDCEDKELEPVEEPAHKPKPKPDSDEPPPTIP